MSADKLLRAAIIAALKAQNTPEATHAAIMICTSEPGDPRIEVALRDALGVER